MMSDFYQRIRESIGPKNIPERLSPMYKSLEDVINAINDEIFDRGGPDRAVKMRTSPTSGGHEIVIFLNLVDEENLITVWMEDDGKIGLSGGEKRWLPDDMSEEDFQEALVLIVSSFSFGNKIESFMKMNLSKPVYNVEVKEL